ncbi:hypothetical protein [Flagellimonas myxillae]|uniref:hypothetical protein n=1 Tax=Flagellimonas myxillae TaxID=2942214 RepID=UPI00201F7A2A|nr:hypothetical protein [Muricauda myxillae]MCL6265305.1 hypothetical protein [Muricauda myxillae]
MMFKFVSYLNFILKSTNEHGVHSPFVFNFVTKCLYGMKKRHGTKPIDVLLKSIAYFDAQNISILDHLEAAQVVLESFPGIAFKSTTYDVVFANEFEEFHFKQQLSEGKLHNDSMILIAGIHQNPKKQGQWNALKVLPNITVSIDMYHLGALFIRKEQQKEHFTIRI